MTECRITYILPIISGFEYQDVPVDDIKSGKYEVRHIKIF
jgi:hypothetical protein